MSTDIVELEWQGDIPDLYCPACGAPIYEGDKETAKCPHVLFTYVSEVGEFDYLDERIKETAAKLTDLAQEDENIDPLQDLLSQVGSDSVLCYGITTTGFGCGPVSSTVYIAVDFNPNK